MSKAIVKNAMIPGEIFPRAGDIELNAGRPVTTLTVSNTGDRPIQVGSHYHFFETNPISTGPRHGECGWILRRERRRASSLARPAKCG